MEPSLINVRRHLGLLSHYFVQYFKVRVSYRADFLIGVVTSMAATLFSLGFVVVLFSRIPSLAGWRFEEVLFLYGFSMIPFGLFNVLSMNLYEFGSTYIIEGKFDRVLLRPVSSLFQVLFEAFRIESFQEVGTGLVVVLWAAHRLSYHWSVVGSIELIFFAVCGGIIYMAVFLALTTVSFFMEDRIGLHPPAWNLLAFGRYPLSIYSGPIQFFLSWIIPFGFATFYPSVRLLGRPEYHQYAPLIPVVAAVSLGIAIFAWNQGVRRYSSTGS
ncbi:MAG TPA: ABC-2 family transporter protein [Candidatus Dormibacteraeota bacterium]|nr:ABC-2 family transporter protein [Candidatus Dormibacteraeota bacterium]